MSVLRSLGFALFQLVVTPLFAIAILACARRPVVDRYRMAAGWCGTVMAGARWICGIRWRTTGTENIAVPPGTHGFVVMCKHSSTWETLALTQLLPPLAYVAKIELLRVPFFGWAFAYSAPITIDRRAGTDAMQQMVAQGRERLAAGFWIVVYPEGTRIRAGTRARYKTGGARLAIELGIPILPVAHNAGYLWPKGFFGKRPGTVTLSFGRPIATEGKDPQQLTAEVEQWIEGEVARLGVPG